MNDAKHPTSIGPYQVVEPLGKGGMASVYRGSCYDQDGWVAIKLIHQSMVREYLAKFRRGDRDKDRDNPLHMFLDEIIIHQWLDHPNVVRYLDEGHHRCSQDGQTWEQPYLVMEYVHGRSLTNVYDRALRFGRERGELPKRWIRSMVGVVEQAALGLHHLHQLRDQEGRSRKAVHRDVAPKNILVGYDGAVKISDFGLVAAEDRVTGTMLGILKGTPAYFSPEQTRAQVVLDCRSDVFALGIVLWELTLLRRLFRREKEVDALLAVRKAQVPSPSAYCSWYPPELEEIVLKAMARDRDERFASALELSEALQAFAARMGRSSIQEDIASVMDELFSPKTLAPPSSRSSSFYLDTDENIPTLEEVPACRPELNTLYSEDEQTHVDGKVMSVHIPDQVQEKAEEIKRSVTAKHTPRAIFGQIGERSLEDSATTRKIVSFNTEQVEVLPVEQPLSDERRQRSFQKFGEDDEDTLHDAAVTRDTIATPIVSRLDQGSVDTVAATPAYGSETNAVDTVPSQITAGATDAATSTRPGHSPLSGGSARPQGPIIDESLTDLSKPGWGLVNRLKKLIGRD